MTLAPLVRHLGRGPGRSRNLERHEAKEAMTAILDGTAEPEAVGALLMLMRYRTENGAEIAGFVDAIRERLGAWRDLPVKLDWPSNASGRSRGLPLFLAAAKLLAQGGYPVMIHGYNGGPNVNADTRAHLDQVDIPLAETPEAAQAALAAGGIVYVPLEALDPEILRVLRLRDKFNLRSPMNTAVKAMNPSGAPFSVQGVFHPPYRELQQEAAAELGAQDLMVIKGGGGEFERHPGKTVEVYGLKDGVAFEVGAEPLLDVTRRLKAEDPEPGDLGRLWRGETVDAFATATITGTAALALWQCKAAGSLAEAQTLAEALWAERPVTAIA